MGAGDIQRFHTEIRYHLSTSLSSDQNSELINCFWSKGYPLIINTKKHFDPHDDRHSPICNS